MEEALQEKEALAEHNKGLKRQLSDLEDGHAEQGKELKRVCEEFEVFRKKYADALESIKMLEKNCADLFHDNFNARHVIKRMGLSPTEFMKAHLSDSHFIKLNDAAQKLINAVEEVIKYNLHDIVAGEVVEHREKMMQSVAELLELVVHDKDSNYKATMEKVTAKEADRLNNIIYKTPVTERPFFLRNFFISEPIEDTMLGRYFCTNVKIDDVLKHYVPFLCKLFDQTQERRKAVPKGTPDYYGEKTKKYKALYAESKDDFKAKLAKKKEKLMHARASYQLWSYRGCIDRDVLPKDCDEFACEKKVFDTFGKISVKVQLMDQASGAAEEA